MGLLRGWEGLCGPWRARDGNGKEDEERRCGGYGKRLEGYDGGEGRSPGEEASASDEFGSGARSGAAEGW